MPMAERRNPGVRILASIAVLSAHVAVLAELLAHRMPVAQISRDESGAIALIDPGREEPPPPPSISLDTPAAWPAAAIKLQPPEIDPAALTDSPSASDWRSAGERVAASVAAADGISVRAFGTTKRPMDKQLKALPFAWDKTHTQRVETLPEGGIRIRLSDRCGMVFAPLPVGGCSLGKVAARGDLFAGMSAAVEPGDWRHTATMLNGR